VLDIAVRLIAGFAAHPDYGVNVLAQALPRSTGLATPADPAPPLVTLYNDSDDGSIAEDLDPDKVPALVFWGDSAADIEMRGYPGAKEVVIGAGFVTAENEKPFHAVRNCGYILRAARQTFTRYNSGDMSEGYKELNGIKIVKVNSVVEQRITAAVGRRKLWGLLEIRATVLDLFP
jgi:hypothetical protein